MAAGELITYTFDVQNTGNVTLTGMVVSDPLPGLGAITCAFPGSLGSPASELVPFETVQCSANYTTTQADIDAGQVDNIATATGTPPVGNDVTDDDPETITATQNPSIDLVKSSLTSTISAPTLVTYDFTIHNTGNV